jgi:hypothetical protein
MADDIKPNDTKEDIPAFKFSPKKVDDSWKEEARKEREAAAAARAAATKAAEPAPATAVPSASGIDNLEAPVTSAETAPASDAPPAKPQSPIEAQQTKIFLHFVDGLAQQALMQMGELENPYTGQAEMDLQGARYTIELLAVILAKTNGNLTETESKALTSVLTDLKTHFAAIAQEMQRQMAAQAAQKGAMRPGPGGTLR